MLAAVVAVTAWNARIMALTSSFSAEIGSEPSNGCGNDGLRVEMLVEDMHSTAIEVDPSLTMPQQGLKKKYNKHRKLIGVAPETSPIAGSNKEIDEHSDVASAKGHPKAMGAGAPTMSQQGLKKKHNKRRNLIGVAPETSPIAGAPTMSQQGLKKKHNKRRNLIGVAPETSPIAGSNKEIDEHSDAASAKGHPKAMGAGAPAMSQRGLKKKHNKRRNLIGVAPETSPIAGSNKEVDEHSDAASVKGHPKAMGAGAPTMSQRGLKKKHNKRRKLIGVPPETSPIAGSNMEIEGQSDVVASAEGFAKAMGPVAMPPSTATTEMGEENYSKLL
ncbi:hypothetical protein GH714_025104 [Hevea brasiliensis]|uniref:Uncharacterized protein n=1 Tax=Hevea brasiliensis TaxID=3981 RepID=A0A6A6M5M7_HEVBR|nr:hypothetical protein GH714_025104 [Hevea brasiliensis]